ncbi:DUF4382 domain-containing protein [Candidatus Bathyarchaeota archaeon]|nr:MAG: DUF4382 domain-containing protein [Candidatus Bathyarchaeota archaeon]
MAKGIAAVIFVILMIGAVSGYFFYTRYVQGTVVLSITDPPQVQPATVQQYDPSILHIYLTFATMEIHQGGFGNSSSSGWYAIVGSQKTVDMISILTTTKTLGSARLSTGIYDQLRFPVSAAVVTFSNLGNVTYSIPSDSLKVSIVGGGFQSSPGTTVNLRLTLSFNSNEIMAMNGQLTPHATARIVT